MRREVLPEYHNNYATTQWKRSLPWLSCASAISVLCLSNAASISFRRCWCYPHTRRHTTNWYHMPCLKWELLLFHYQQMLSSYSKRCIDFPWDTSHLQAGDTHLQGEEAPTASVPGQPPTGISAYQKFTLIHRWSASSVPNCYCFLVSFLPRCCSHPL